MVLYVFQFCFFSSFCFSFDLNMLLCVLTQFFSPGFSRECWKVFFSLLLNISWIYGKSLSFLLEEGKALIGRSLSHAGAFLIQVFGLHHYGISLAVRDAVLELPVNEYFNCYLITLGISVPFPRRTVNLKCSEEVFKKILRTYFSAD